METLAAPKRARKPTPPRPIPESLIYEVMDGKPLYYRGYRDVVAGKKKKEQIMGSSGLQGIIVMYLAKIIARNLDDDRYFSMTNEPGLHLDARDNLAGDVLIYEKTALPVARITDRYLDLPAKVVLEVDVKIDPTQQAEYDYVHTKTEKLLRFGTEKVLWIFSRSRKVMIAESGKDWLTVDWHREVELLDGATFNVGAYLAKEGIEA